MASTPASPQDGKVSWVLVIYVGGTIGMKRESDVYVPARNYMAGVIRSMPPLCDSEYALNNNITKDSDGQDMFPLPLSRGCRVIYTLKEYEHLIDSSNVTVDDWRQMAKDIRDNYKRFHGFVIIHGTDTMAYTASALSFMLENLGKPVVLTGAQVPLSELRSDGLDNILGSVFLAGYCDIPEVTLFFNNKLYQGNRCVKISSESFNAFNSPNLPPLVTMAVDITVNWPVIFPLSATQPFCLNTNMNENVGLLRIFPSITAETVKAFLQPPMAGVVLQTYGAGNCPDDRPELLKALKDAALRGVIIMNCTQCSNGGVSADYATGKVLLDVDVIPGSDITPEAALSKLSYVLGQALSNEEKRKLLKCNLRGEISVSLDNRKFIRVLVTTLKIGGSDEVQAVGQSLFPTPMCAAARNGNLDLIKSLQKSGADLEGADYDGRTPLHLAASEGHTEVTKYLLEKGCSISVRDRFGNTPLLASIKNRKFDVVKQIMDHGHQTHESLSELVELLCSAAERDDVDELKAFKLAGVDISFPDYSRNTALQVAEINNKPRSVQYLLECGASPTKTNADGLTAANVAAQEGVSKIAGLIGKYEIRN